MPRIITCPACKKAKPESDFALQKNGFRQKRCQTCAERQKRYYYKRKAEKYLTPSEVNKFPPIPEILKPAYWHKTEAAGGKYVFHTQNSGSDTVKSPMGLFDADTVDNDLSAVDDAIRAYYGITTEKETANVQTQ